jgi:hypothetical protein
MRFSCKSLFVFYLMLVIAVGCDKDNNSPKGGSKGGTESRTIVSPDDALLLSRSLALLENRGSDKEGKGLGEAVDGFRKLTKAYPKDPVGSQNLCIGLLFQMQDARQQSAPTIGKLEKEFEETVKQLQSLNPNSPDPWILEARYHSDNGDMGKFETLLRTATQKPDAGSDTLFQLVEHLQSSDKSAKPEEVRKLLESAIKLSPTNIALAVYYLNALAVQEDEAAFTDQLKKCREHFAPFISRTGSQLPKLMDNIPPALEKKNWNVVRNLANGTRNVLLGEIAYQNDLHLLRPHSLEFVRLQFSGNTTPSSSPTEVAIRFEPSKLEIANSSKVLAIAAEDMDLDGRFDIAIVQQSGVDVYSVAGEAPNKILSIGLTNPIQKLLLADLDRDFQYRGEAMPASALPTTNPPGSPPILAPGLVDTDLDLVVFGEAGIQLFENQLSSDKKSRSLVERKISDEMVAIKGVTAVAAIDLDHDSDLDLVIASKSGISLWSNRGDWSFADFTSYSNLPDPSKRYDSILAFDADRNVLMDLVVGSDETAMPAFLGNNLHGRYHTRNIAWPKELAGTWRAIEAIDANRDACWDLVSCGEKGVQLLTMKSPGRDGGWVPDSSVKLSDRASHGLLSGDFNNDGFMDCVSWGATGAELFAGQVTGTLSKVDKSIQLDQPLIQLLAFDIDEDGDDDVVGLTKEGELLLQKNVDGNKNQRLTIVLRADEDGSQRPRERCNMHGVGSLVELKAKGVYQSQIVRGTRTRFGLGAAKEADIMRVVWTNGTPNNIMGVKNSSTIFDQQRLSGSCPYLYAWNGERFEFVTDCLWAAPIGLQFGPGVLAPARDWEYLKIDGSALKPKDGKYILQMTEELWEAAYFDAIQLMVVDHPAELDIYSNEKVGPADIAEFKIYTVKQRLQPKVKDQNGNDLNELIDVRDSRYTKTWAQGFNQGLTEQHWLEIDLNLSAGENKKQSDEKVLYLTGWIFPTCTSLNLAMAENPLTPKLMPPSIQVPDENGNWATVIPFSGFPGGKTKTIAIDMKGKFLSNDHRVRLVSNMELCWDEVFFSEGERTAAEGSYRIERLDLLTADLHYRGFSDQEMRPGNAPNHYEYSRVFKESVWAPMRGNFTRFGEVTGLLREADDFQAVLGAGDEVTLEFAEPKEKLPDGWVRDFIIYNVGWDKDADLNTIQGQNVEPLPFRAMKRYPYEPEQQFPNTPAHLEYLRKYQTRHHDAGIFWNQIRDAL